MWSCLSLVAAATLISSVGFFCTSTTLLSCQVSKLCWSVKHLLTGARTTCNVIRNSKHVKSIQVKHPTLSKLAINTSIGESREKFTTLSTEILEKPPSSEGKAPLIIILFLKLSLISLWTALYVIRRDWIWLPRKKIVVVYSPEIKDVCFVSLTGMCNPSWDFEISCF